MGHAIVISIVISYTCLDQRRLIGKPSKELAVGGAWMR